MTREEAIKSLQNIIEYWTYKPTEVEAAKMAIAALRPVSREQVERVRGEWINTNKEVEQMCKCSKCGYPISYFWSRTPFCPNCGAPMTDEAVDMVLKR
jgi:hypothetical protein